MAHENEALKIKSPSWGNGSLGVGMLDKLSYSTNFTFLLDTILFSFILFTWLTGK